MKRTLPADSRWLNPPWIHRSPETWRQTHHPRVRVMSLSSCSTLSWERFSFKSGLSTVCGVCSFSHAQMFSFIGMFSLYTGDLSMVCTCWDGLQYPQWFGIKRRWTDICCEMTVPSSKISYSSLIARQASTVFSLNHFKGYLEYFIMIWVWWGVFLLFIFSNTVLLLAPATSWERYQSHHLSGKRRKKSL